MHRRDFLIRSTTVAATFFTSKNLLAALANQQLPNKILRHRHRHPGQHRNQNQPSRHGYRHRRLRPSFQSNRARP